MGAFDGVFETYRRTQSFKDLEGLKQERVYLGEVVKATSNRITAAWVESQIAIVEELISKREKESQNGCID